MNTRNFLFPFLFISTHLEMSLGIRCYQCGSESIFMDYDQSSVPVPMAEEREDTLLVLESCSNLEFSFASWGTYVVDCAPDQVCVKIIRDDGIDRYGRHQGYFTSSRSCANRNTTAGLEHKMGCGVFKSSAVPPVETFENKYDLVCFCNSDYCNGSNRKEMFTTLSFISLFIGMSLLVRLISGYY